MILGSASPSAGDRVGQASGPSWLGPSRRVAEAVPTGEAEHADPGERDQGEHDEEAERRHSEQAVGPVRRRVAAAPAGSGVTEAHDPRVLFMVAENSSGVICARNTCEGC